MDTQEPNGAIATEDSEMADCEGEKVMTMMDVLQEQQDFEDDANAVLGASDDKECTYSKGYIKRQAIYACLTCCSEAKTDPSKRAGVCLACSLNCHENHDLVELYTKRNFRCDCGNPKFDGKPCQFTPNKSELNEDNSYNQNFSGVYCTCSRPYPDPECSLEDEMIQCIICEDWLHASHLETKLPQNEYAEMICKGCMDKNEFLHDYSSLAVNELENEEVDVDDSITKDFTMNGETVKVNGLNGSAVEEIENGVKDDMDKGKAEEKEVCQSEEKTDNLETASESMDTDRTDQTAVELSIEDTSKLDDLSEDKVNPEDKNAEATPDQLTTQENAPSEAAVADGTADTSEKIVSTEEKIAEASSEEKPGEPEQEDKSEPITEETPTENVESTEKTDDVESTEKVDNVESTAKTDNIESAEKVEDVESTEKVDDVESTEKVELGEQHSEEKEQDKIGSLVDSTNTTETSSAAPVQNKEVLVATVDDDNKEIDAIDKLLAEGTNEDKSESESAPEKMETNTETPSEITSDTNNKPEEEAKEIDENKVDEASLNENAEVEPSKEVGDAPSDVEMNPVSTNKEETSESVPMIEPVTNGTSEVKENKRKLSTDDVEESQDTKKPKLSSSCTRPRAGKKIFKGATFWPSHFRQKLCTCSECITMYKDLSVLFLTDLEDTVKAYEDLGKERNGAASTQYEKGLEALSSLDRIQQINALTEYNKMKDKLLDFLKSFKDRKEIVKEEDIKSFFAQMKPKREPDGVYFCR